MKSHGPAAVRRVTLHQELTPKWSVTDQALHAFALADMEVLVPNTSGTSGASGGANVPPKGPTPADMIAEGMGLGHFRDHGDPSSWKYLGKTSVPSTEPGRQPGSTKVYEVFLDENGKQIEWHYWVNPDGTVDGGKIVFPGTTSCQGLAR